MQSTCAGAAGTAEMGGSDGGWRVIGDEVANLALPACCVCCAAVRSSPNRICACACQSVVGGGNSATGTAGSVCGAGMRDGSGARGSCGSGSTLESEFNARPMALLVRSKHERPRGGAERGRNGRQVGHDGLQEQREG